MARTFKAARLQDIPPGSMKAVTVLNHEVLIINLDGVLYGIEARCPHMKYPLQLGSLRGKVLRCGFHYAEFDVATGKALSQRIDGGSPVRNLKTYRVSVEGPDVIVELSD